MKKILSLFLILMLSLAMALSLVSCGETEEDPEKDDEEGIYDIEHVLQYTLSFHGDYYIVSGFGIHHNKRIEIPETHEGKPVREIEPRAFLSNMAKENLEEIVIPASVTKIGEYAFKDCTLLRSVTFLGTIDTIEKGTFDGCTSLSEINLPEGLTTIGELAFDGCLKLPAITIPDTVTKIGSSAFRACPYIVGNKANPSGGVYTLPTPSGSWVVKCDNGIENAAFPEGTVGIIDSALIYARALKVIDLPTTLKYIGDKAFRSVDTLTTVNYAGAPDDWNNISIGEDNLPLLNAQITYGK